MWEGLLEELDLGEWLSQAEGCDQGQVVQEILG